MTRQVRKTSHRATLKAEAILEIVGHIISHHEFMRRALAIDHELCIMRPRVYVTGAELLSMARAIRNLRGWLDSLIKTDLGPDIDYGILHESGFRLLSQTRRTCEWSTILTEWLDQAATASEFRWISIRHALKTICSKEQLEQFSYQTEQIIKEARSTWIMTMSTLLEEAEHPPNELKGLKNHKSHPIIDGFEPLDLELIEDAGDQQSLPILELLARPLDLDRYLRERRETSSSYNSARLLERLAFPQMLWRHESIPRVHYQTFDWIYRDDGARHEDSTPQPSFTQWLRSKDTVFWIYGQPGAGKSALMKMIYHDPRTREAACEWADDCQTDEVQFASHWFWKLGFEAQRSMEGLLRSLLYQLLHDQDNKLECIMRERSLRAEVFEQYDYPYTESELHSALESFLLQNEKCLLIFLDGLDEHEGNSYELASLIHKLAATPRIKVCVASRPWPAFVEAFGSRPKLAMVANSSHDIGRYVKAKLGDSRIFGELERYEPLTAKELQDAVIEKANGSFLWAHIAVRSLMRGLQDGDRIDELRQMLDHVYPEMEVLFQEEIQKSYNFAAHTQMKRHVETRDRSDSTTEREARADDRLMYHEARLRELQLGYHIADEEIAAYLASRQERHVPADSIVPQNPSPEKRDARGIHKPLNPSLNRSDPRSVHKPHEPLAAPQQTAARGSDAEQAQDQTQSPMPDSKAEKSDRNPRTQGVTSGPTAERSHGQRPISSSNADKPDLRHLISLRGMGNQLRSLRRLGSLMKRPAPTS